MAAQNGGDPAMFGMAVALAIGIVQIMFGMLLKVVTISLTAGFRYSLASLGWLLVILAGSLAGGLPMLNPRG